MSPEKPRGMWELFGSVVNKKFYATDEELNKLSSFMFCRYISADPRGCMIANEICMRSDFISNQSQYRLAYNGLPKGYGLKFPSKEKIQSNETLDNIMTYYNCNIQQAIEYNDLMSDNERERINSIYEDAGYTKTKKGKK